MAAARAAGFLRVGVQTNGEELVDPARLERLKGMGLADVHLTALGADAQVHDYHTGRAHSFERVLACFAAARAAALEVVVSTVLTRSNFRTLDALAALLVQRGAAAWCISVPVVTGGAEASFDRVVPRLGLAVPFALRALAFARSRGVPSFVAGAPLCLLGPIGADAIGEERRAYAPVCEGCRARDVCPGVDAAYLERFDGDELAPRATLARPVQSAPVLRFAALFTGTGERAPLRGLSAAVSPAKARRTLPLLGRGQPAAAEVGRGEKRTGEALRVLFPGLFDESARTVAASPARTADDGRDARESPDDEDDSIARRSRG